MNVYTITITPKAMAGAGIGHLGNDRQITIVTDSLQDAMSIARGRITDKEEIAGVWTTSTDVIVDYSQVIKTS